MGDFSLRLRQHNNTALHTLDVHTVESSSCSSSTTPRRRVMMCTTAPSLPFSSRPSRAAARYSPWSAATSNQRQSSAHRATQLQSSPSSQLVTQPPSKGSLRGSKCTPLCNSQLPACKPIVCRRSQVSKSYIDAEQCHQRSSILDTCCMTSRARALSACMQ